MKAKTSKKIISILLMLCICFSNCVPARSDEINNTTVKETTIKANPFVGNAVNTAINKLYTFGLSVAGEALTRIAGATGSEELQEIVSFLDKWVCGNGQKRANAAIVDLCKQILEELKVIETTLSDYTAQIEQSIGEQNFTNAMKTLNAQWETDVHSLEGNGIEDALNKYKDYMAVAQDYADGKATSEDMDRAKDKLFNEFCNMYKTKASIPVEDNTTEKLKERVFGDTIVNDILHSSISSMKNNLLKDTNYADALAQFAYQALPLANQQYEYIKAGINQQFTEIVLLEMLHEEFLSQYGEYLKEKYPDNQTKWTGYSKLVDDFETLNEEVAVNMGAVLDRDLKVYPAQNITKKLNEFPIADSEEEVVLHNTDFRESVQYKITAGVTQADTYTSISEYIFENETFKKLYTLTNTGINTFYIKTGNKESFSVKVLDFKEDISQGYDVHNPSCDYYNIAEKYYTDGTNKKIRCALQPTEISQLFNLNSYSMAGSIPQSYLSSYFSYSEGNPVFILFTGCDVQADKSAFKTVYAKYTNLINAENVYPYSDFLSNKTTTLSLEDVQNGKKYSNAFYSVIFVNEEGAGNHTVDVAKSGSGNSEIYIKNDDKNEESTTVKEGDTFTIRFKAASDDTVLKSVTLQKHNNATDKKEVTNERVIFTREDLENMTADEDGYFTVECPACFADTTVLLDTEKGYFVTTETESAMKGNIEFDLDTNLYLPGDTVSFNVGEEINSIVMKYGDTSKQLELVDYGSHGIGGSFTMPSSDVTLVYKANDKNHVFDDNGFCINCGFYEPALLNDNKEYVIKNAGNLFWFSSLVQGDKSLAEFENKNMDANAVLVADINLSGHDWKSIDIYYGTIDGQNHKISNLNIDIKEATNYVGFCNALFGTIKNLTVEGNMTFHADCEHIGGIVGDLDSGTISNVTSIVNISNTAGELKHVGGIVGTVEKTKSTTATVDKCLNYGSINISNSTDCIGGIAAYTNTGGRISNCANFGNITTTKAGAYTGGILGYINNTEPSIKDCYNYGSVSNSGNTTYCGAIIGWARNYTAQNISNNYYLDSSASLALGKDSKTGADIEAKNSNQFSSGEVAYLLNNKVTDGTQAWYQTIGKEVVPVLKSDSKTVFKVTEQLCPGSRQETVYSNTNEDKCGEHNFVNGKCTYCGLEQQKEFDEDIEGNLIIKTYDDLVKLAQLIRSDYDTYGSKDYILVNNIIAPSDSVWTMGIGSVAENKPFNGNFKGDGYCIMGLNIDASLYGGLFEIIGENGHVQNLFILNCTYMTSCENAGSIAAINTGTIDYCTNGMTVGSAIIFTNPLTKNPVKASEFNSEIKGTLSGGIAAQNTGVITGCRNAGTVLGTECGGIAGINTGKIYGCVNNGAIGYANSSLTQTAGGIAGKNGGSIASSYNSSSIYGKSGKAVGSIAGLNGFDSETSPEIRNVFYITINGLHGVGTDSLVTNLDASNIVKKQNDMKKDSFTDELNNVTDDSVRWCRSDTLNNGYPKVENTIFEQIVRELNNGIKLKGSMHSSLNISCDLMKEDSAEYKNLVADIITNRGLKVLKGYSLSLSDKEGNPMFADSWIQGDVELSIPVDSEHVMLLALDSSGQIKEYKPISFINGAATFKMMAEPISFILVDSRTDIANTTVKTGDLNNAVLWFLTIISGGLFVAVAWQKRKKTNE